MKTSTWETTFYHFEHVCTVWGFVYCFFIHSIFLFFFRFIWLPLYNISRIFFRFQNHPTGLYVWQANTNNFFLHSTGGGWILDSIRLPPPGSIFCRLSGVGPHKVGCGWGKPDSNVSIRGSLNSVGGGVAAGRVGKRVFGGWMVYLP